MASSPIAAPSAVLDIPFGVGRATGGLPQAVRAAAFEIGQPLDLLSVLVRRLAPHVVGAEGQALLELLAQENGRAQALTLRLADLGCPDAPLPARAAIDLGEIVREVLAAERHRIVVSPDLLELALTDGADRIWADRLQVGQALRHLLGCVAGGPRSAETPRRFRVATAPRRDAVLLQVMDLSPAGVVPRFTGWAAPAPPTTPPASGLAIVRMIVREHGAEFAVTSHPGQGTCYSIAWPRPTVRS